MRTVLKTPYWAWPNELSSSLCDAIIEEGCKLTEKQPFISNNSRVDNKVRQGSVSWLSNSSWVADIISGYVHRANKLAGWNFSLNDSDKVQFGKYTAGSFYTWHRDVIIRPKYRKLSVTVQLSDPASYRGGDFEMKDLWDKRKLTFKEDIRQRGTIIVFPSLLKHQVTEVTDGTRYSLVHWHNGPDFV